MSTTQETGTYRTLDEQMERLTPAEQRFERARQTIGLFVGPVVFVVLLLIPMPIDDNQQRLAAVLGFTIVYWLSEAIPIPATAILSLALCVLLQVPVIPSDSDDSASDIVYGSFASDTIFLFIGAFVIAQAMKTHGLDRRFAFRVLSLPGVASSTYAVIIAFGAIAALLSSVISNTATAAMLLPIGLGMMRALGDLVVEQSDEDADASRLRFGTALMLMISYGAGVGGLLTPIGTPPNLIGIAFIESETDTTITFFDWVITAAPIVLLMFIALCVILILLNKPEVRRLTGADTYIAEQKAELGRLSRGEKNTLAVFGVAVTLWVLPGFVALFAGDESDAYAWISARLDEGTVAILGAVLLFVLPVDWARRRFTMNWNEAVKIDWGTVILFGSGIVLGTLLSQTGLAETLGTGIADSLGVTSLVAVSAVAALIAIVISETTSNTAAATIVVPIVIPIAAAAGLDPVIPALCAVFGASFGFMMPVSTPQNAVVYGSGMIPITKMVRSGIVFDVIGIILIVALVPVMAAVSGIV
ncbi:SLC13 family permease [Nocardioides euryhalodurans]|uniref:Sodium-dependent dicarboxylate transporter SdcS n=1 Tax=Nocardioides euryhalodurans TaxID=2518370 RepID=A0A4V1BDZ6_9ACTN|nr:DASS family sodium-coupled anion symporter [Nocardioides euryhalodurans]QBR92852.1 DASS family sodium-coupled anion symporter [Nocardioides euryhalodurans]